MLNPLSFRGGTFRNHISVRFIASRAGSSQKSRSVGSSTARTSKSVHADVYASLSDSTNAMGLPGLHSTGAIAAVGIEPTSMPVWGAARTIRDTAQVAEAGFEPAIFGL